MRFHGRNVSTFCCELISTHTIDYAGRTRPCLPLGWIQYSRSISVPRNDRKFKHFMFLNTLKPRQYGYRITNVFKRTFLNENVWILIKMSLKCVAKGPVNNIPSLLQVMAWRRSGDKPISEPMVVRLQMHLGITRPQWVNNSSSSVPEISMMRDD